MINELQFATTRLGRRALAPAMALAVGLLVLVCGPAAKAADAGGGFDASTESGFAALVKAAKAEGALSLYSGLSGAQNDAITGLFEKTYGIPVTVLRLNSPAVAQRHAAEAQAHNQRADVLIASVPNFFSDHPDWFAKLTPREIPALKDFPRDLLTERSFVNTLSPLGVQYNTNKVSKAEVPATWKDLLAPRWRGKMMLTDPRASENYAGWADGILKAHDAAYLKGIAAQQPKVTHSGGAGAQQIAAGAFDLNIPVVPAFALALQQKKAPIMFKPLIEPSLAIETDGGIASEAPHPAAARLFVNYLLTDEAIRTVCKLTIAATPRAMNGQLGCAPLPADTKRIKYGLDKARLNAISDALGLP